MSLPRLKNILDKLRDSARRASASKGGYSIPSLWIDGSGGRRAELQEVNPFDFFHDALRRIKDQPRSELLRRAGGEWSRHAVIYNMFVRSSCAFDHNQNGKLDLPANEAGWRETGTFLKGIALLPYIRSLGANVVHLLPITSIGADGNKGTLGSPYAIKNPYELDKNLAEPNLGLGPDEEFKAFVEAAHHLGIRVVVEFVFRTSAKDGDWVKDHPEWFYWIRESVQDRPPGVSDESRYGSPLFTKEEMKKILRTVEEGELDDLPPPHQEYLDLFTPPPPKHSIQMAGSRYIGMLREHTAVRIPGAFADWPPDDSQPPWGDVTFLKMYNHPDFNYIAYNTIRMYDTRLARKENVNRPLWQKVADIIPHYQKEYGIDGVMIDMGHALPMELKKEMIRLARSIDPDFAFWDENFSVEEQSVREGYNAVIGYVWSDQHKPEKFKDLLRRFSREGYALPFFATPESHNTPRASTREGGIVYSRYAWAISNFIPAIPFIHSGFELGEKCPVNTGLDFSREELARYPSASLPLFSEYAYDWTSKEEFTEWIKTISDLRNKYQDLIIDQTPQSFEFIETDNINIISFLRVSSKVHYKLLVIANSSMKSRERVSMELPGSKRHLTDLLSGSRIDLRDGLLTGNLAPGQVIVAEL
jgi:glycosidase